MPDVGPSLLRPAGRPPAPEPGRETGRSGPRLVGLASAVSPGFSTSRWVPFSRRAPGGSRGERPAWGRPLGRRGWGRGVKRLRPGAGLPAAAPVPRQPPEHRRSPSVIPPERGVRRAGFGFRWLPRCGTSSPSSAPGSRNDALYPPRHLCRGGSQLGVGTVAGPWRAEGLAVASWAPGSLWIFGQVPGRICPVRMEGTVPPGCSSPGVPGQRRNCHRWGYGQTAMEKGLRAASPVEVTVQSSTLMHCLSCQAGWKGSFLLFFQKAAESHLLLTPPAAATTDSKHGGR